MSVPADVESLVADAPVSAHFATSVDDRPHVAPVWYGYRDGVVYFVTGGKKLANARRNPNVALSIEAAHDGDVEWTVTLLGTATVVDDPDRIEWAEDWIYDAYEEDPLDDDANEDEGTASDDEGDTTEADTDADDETADADDETADADDEPADDVDDYALVEVEIGSTSWSVYD